MGKHEKIRTIEGTKENMRKVNHNLSRFTRKGTKENMRYEENRFSGKSKKTIPEKASKFAQRSVQSKKSQF